MARGRKGYPKEGQLNEHVNILNPEHRARIYLIIQELRKFTSTEEIAHMFSKEWGITELCIKQHFIGAAKKLLKESVSDIVEDVRAEQTAKYMDLYRIAYERGQVKQCTIILNSIDKIYGLEKSVIESKSDVTINFGGDTGEENE